MSEDIIRKAVKHFPRKERKEVVSARPRYKSFMGVRGDEGWQLSKDSADAATAISFMSCTLYSWKK